MILKLFLNSFYLTLCLLIVDDAFAQPSSSINQSVFENTATIDLRLNTWGNGEIHSLKGDWPFSWNSFTHDLADKQTNTWQNVYVPGAWNQDAKALPETDKLISPKGYGTYYKEILVPMSLDKVYIYLPDMASAYELWSNNVRRGGNGTIATDKAHERPAYLPHVYEFTPQNGKIELFIKTSNFHYQWGGIWYAPRITDASGVHLIRDLPILKAVTSGTILLGTAIFCLLIFLSRPKDKKILFFSLFCFAIGIRRLSMDERVLYLFNSFDWQTLQATENITMYLMLPFFLSYFQLIFPQATSRKLPLLAWLCAVPFSIAALYFDVETYSGLNLYFQALLLLFVPCILYSWGRALKLKLKHAKIFGLSLFVFLFAVINDMLNYSYVIHTTNLTHLGVLAFVLFQLTGLVRRYLKNFRSIETLSKTLQEQNKELIKLDEFKNDFLASTSHELRMPLHGIAGLAKTIKQESSSLSKGAQNRVNLIEASAKRLGNLVNDILDIASMKHDKLSIQVSASYLKPLVESTIQSLKPLIKNKPIKLDFTIDEDANQVLADEQRLQQILYNLIGNAIKFTEKGFIHITAHRQNEKIQIQVSDSGIGFSSEQLDRALKPFETNANQSHNEIRGTGLGLPITRMLVELHQGTLTLKSNEGEGTVAEFTLPWAGLTPESKEAESDAKHYELEVLGANEVPSSSKENSVFTSMEGKNKLTENALIFYADDEEVNRELVTSQLVAAGYQIKVFPDGQSLIDYLPCALPDLILLDWMMPGKNGLEVCKEIRQQYDAYNLPVIMLTARHQVHDIVQALNVGANDYLTKPYHEQELTARVYSQVSVKRLLLSSLENEQLKNEVQHQQRQKQQLNLANLRLANALDTTQESILILNEDLDIEFANKGAKSLIEMDDIDQSELDAVDTSITRYLDETSTKQLRVQLNTGQRISQFPLQFSAQALAINASIQITGYEDERYLSIIIHGKGENASTNTQTLLTSLTQEIAENRQRMEHIESTLMQLNVEEQEVQPEVSTYLPQDSEQLQKSDPKEIVVKTLSTTLIAWERYTHKTKADLAEESHCWRVYIDGATAKTRTLDKYLSVNTLPAKPRWRAVIKTANHVLDHCALNEEDQLELSELVQQLNEAYS